MTATNLTTRDLIEQHNALAPEHMVLSTWKKSKDELTARIARLKPRKGAVCELIASKVVYTDLPYAEIVKEVRRTYPNARTTTRSVASIAHDLKAFGFELPARSRSKREVH